MRDDTAPGQVVCPEHMPLRRVKVKRAGHDVECPVYGRLIRKGQEITTYGAGYPQHANPSAARQGQSGALNPGRIWT